MYASAAPLINVHHVRCGSPTEKFQLLGHGGGVSKTCASLGSWPARRTSPPHIASNSGWRAAAVSVFVITGVPGGK